MFGVRSPCELELRKCRLAAIQEKRQCLETEVRELAARSRQHVSELNSIRAHLKDLKEQRDALVGYAASCPVCRTFVAASSSLPFNSCGNTGRRRYSTTPPDLVPCSPLCSSSVSCFPAPSQLSSSMCSLVFLCLDNLEGSCSELFFVILLPAFLIVCPVHLWQLNCTI